MLADGDIIEVKVEGWRAVHYALGSDAEVLDDLSAGRVPEAWTPLETTTSGRGRLPRPARSRQRPRASQSFIRL